MQRAAPDIPALHGELVNQALGQGRPALVRTFPASNDFDPVVGFGGFSLTLAVEHRLAKRRAIAREHQDQSCLGPALGRQDGQSGKAWWRERGCRYGWSWVFP